MLSVVEWLMKLEERRVLLLFERLYWELVIFVYLVMQLSLRSRMVMSAKMRKGGIYYKLASKGRQNSK